MTAKGNGTPFGAHRGEMETESRIYSTGPEGFRPLNMDLLDYC